MGLRIPPAGYGVYTAQLGAVGAAGEEFEIRTDPDGTVRLMHVGGEVLDVNPLQTEAPAAHVPTEKGEVGGSPLGCHDNFEPAISHVESDNRQWYFNQSTAPADVGGTAAAYQVQDGNYNLTKGWTNCPGYSGFVNIASTYKGNTTKKAEMDANGNCEGFLSRDGANVTDFGDLPSTKLGQACTWYFGVVNEIAETDIRLNKVEMKWTTAGLSLSCSGQYDIESVVTHETGHAYGMGHALENGHANMTMSERSNGTCQASEATLAAGTLIALSVYY